MNERKLSYYLSKANDLDIDKFEKKIRIAILSSFTLNGLADTLKVKCAENKIVGTAYLGGYNQYAQEILNSQSQLYKFLPDITFLILDTRSILGELFYNPYSIPSSKRNEFVENKIIEINSIVSKFKENFKSKLVLFNLLIPTYSSYGIAEGKGEFGLQQMVSGFNAKLMELTKDDSTVFVYDFNGFATRYGEINIFDYRKFFYGDVKLSFDYIPYLAHDLMGYVKPILGMNRKCIVVDLDNTLWGGVVGEDGIEGIKLGPSAPGNAFVELQKRLLSLHQHGIILAINSKNNPDDALQVIREHPYMILKEEHFACLKINWNDKISNMREIAEEINIGLDSLVFLEDDPVNREFMKLNLPEVLTVDLPQDPSNYAQALMELNDFNVLKITEEDLQRGKMYFQERQRTEFEKSSTNLEDFLKQLNIKLRIRNANQFTVPRISQLTLKTNQFNLTTKRYQEEDISRLASDKNMIVKCVQVEDKFGDNGITGVFIVNKDNKSEWIIDTFLLSCRVMGRGIEEGMLGHILDVAKKEGVKKVKGVYIPTKKNKPCEDFLPNCGFKKETDYWVCNLDNALKIPEHLAVIVDDSK